MKTHDIEAWALQAIERVESKQPNEDSRIELKADWPEDAEKGARRIAAHANAQRGEPILWLIGVDESRGVLGASQKNLADWWPQIKAQFEGPTPEVRDVLISRNGATIVALYFSETDRLPFLVKNPAFGKQNGGPVQREVPWRDGTATRSATHTDLIQLLVPLQLPKLTVEVGSGRAYFSENPLSQPVGVSTAACFLRVKVLNTGHRTARNGRGYLENVEILTEGAFRDTRYIDYLRLVWSYHGGWPSLDLLPNVPHYLDLVSTLEHGRSFFLETDPKTTRYGGGFGELGLYRLTASVFAEDTPPAKVQVYLQWRGQWNSVEVFDHCEWERREAVG